MCRSKWGALGALWLCKNWLGRMKSIGVKVFFTFIELKVIMEPLEPLKC